MNLSDGTHGVIIVHGIGDQKRGDTVAEFSKAIYNSLINSPKDGNKRPMIKLEELDVFGNPPSVTLEITSPYNDNDKAKWLCQEAYWNDAFPPPSATQVLWWGLNQNLRSQLGSVLKILKDPTNKDLPTAIERQKEEAKAKRLKAEIELQKEGALTKELKTAIERQKEEALAKRLKETEAVELGKTPKFKVGVKSGGISAIALIVLTPLAYLLLFIIWLLHFVPSIGPLDKVISWIRKLDPFISSSLGDIKRYIDHEIWSANAKKRLEDIILSMLNNSKIKDITIVAHSMGAVLAYDALTEGGRIAVAIDNSGGSISKKITLVSVGAAINRVFTLISQGGKKYDHLQIKNQLAEVITKDKFYWLDIFARKDPVPAGPITLDIIKNRAKIDPKEQMKERRVINKDSLIFDHNSYWENIELVMPRITRAINGGEEDPWPEAGITDKKVSERVQKAFKFDNLSQKIMFLVMLGLIIFLCLKLTGTI